MIPQNIVPVVSPNNQPEASNEQQEVGASSSNHDLDSDSPRRYHSLTDIYASSNFVLFAGEPQSFEEAEREEVWREAISKEIESIEKNQIWELVDLPKEKDAIGLK